MEENKKKTTKTTTKKSTAKTTKTTTKKTVAKPTKKTETKKVVKTTKEEKSPVEETKVVKEASIDVVEKELDKTTSRFWIIIGFVAGLILFSILYANLTYQTSAKIAKKVSQLKASNKTELVYLMKEDCQYCKLNETNMKTLKEKYGVDYYSVDIANLAEEDKLSVVNTLELDAENLGTPTLVLVKDNQVLDVLEGIQAFDTLFNSLQTNGVIGMDVELYLNYIGYKEYKQILKSKTPEIVVLTSTYCQYCIPERPVLEEIAEAYGVKINWMYLNTAFASQQEYDDFNSSLKWFEDNPEWGTPTTLVIQNGKVVSALSGYREKADMIQFLRQNGFIK